MGALACSLIALLLGSLGGTGPKYMETVVQDDASFMHRPAAQVQRNIERVAALGADRIRLTASWSALTANPSSKSVPPAPFDASDSKTYPKGAFTSLDNAVKDADAQGLSVMIDLAFWAPRWAVGEPASNPSRQRYYVDASAFGDFATAVARRYSGAFPDPANSSRDLPAVRMFTTWNEPNHPSFLMPQWVKNPDGSYRAESPHIYRAMHNKAYDAIKKVSLQDKVLIGGTASTGSQTPGKGGVAPLEFLRGLACVDKDLRPLNIPECKNFTPLKADGYADHPYSRYTTPGTSDPFTDDAPIADVSRLDDLLAKLAVLGRIAGDLPIYDTEYGYESNEDDPFQPFDRMQQAEFIGWSTFLAWKDPNTKMFAQFLLQDIDPAESGRKKGTRAYYRDWQTGLYDAKGNPKPALQAFKMPFWAQTLGTGDTKSVMVWGEVRPGSGAHVVKVERQDPNTGNWAAIHTFGPTCNTNDPDQFTTDKAGFFLRSAPALGASFYRFGWQHDDGTWEYSVPIKVADDGSQAPPL